MSEAAPQPAGTDGKKLPTYERYLAETGAMVVRAPSVPSLVDLDLAARPDGTSAATIQLPGMQGLSSMSVVEVPPGGELPATRHLYEEYVLVLSGSGTVTFYGSEGGSREHEWRRETVFAIPLNMKYSLRNTGDQPARLVLVNNAQLWMDLLGSTTAAFECDLSFPERESMVLDGREPVVALRGRRMAFSGPVFHDLGTRPLPEHEFIRGPGFGYLLLNLSAGVYGCHVGELPEGHISNAHWHMGGAVLIAMAGEGYTLSWPHGLGPRPAQEDVERQEFRYSGAVTVGTGDFHLHANTGRGPLRQVAFRYGGGAGATFSTVQGIEYAPGRVVDIEDLSQAIMSDYRELLASHGIPIAV
jgi:mannose-6-phosphate isomerase-like protein (cupin superfamily)